MDGVGLKSKKNNKYKDKFWDKLEQLEQTDPDIALEVRKGNRVKIVEDSTGEIEIPEYPNSDSNY